MSEARRDTADYPMSRIPAGEIHLRDDRIRKSWTVEVEAFLLAPVPVTQALYFSRSRTARANG